MRDLEVLGNQIQYKAVPTEPLFDVMESRAQALRTMYTEYKGFRMSVSDLRYETTGPVQDQHMSIVFGIGYCKVATDRIEAHFSNWATHQYPEIIKAMDAMQSVARTLVTDLKFASHHFVYYGHLRIADLTFADFVKELPAPVLSKGGESLGTGFNFHWREPRRGWRSTLKLDASLAHPGALFVAFEADIVGDELKVGVIGPELQEYLGSILGELGLKFSEQSNAVVKE